MKHEVLVRFATDSYYVTTVTIDPNKLTDIYKFPQEVFATIDGVLIAIRREDFD
jgi:hypothetical protein